METKGYTEIKHKTNYTTSDLISFAKYVFSEAQTEDSCLSKERLTLEVYDADIANWEQIEKEKFEKRSAKFEAERLKEDLKKLLYAKEEKDYKVMYSKEDIMKMQIAYERLEKKVIELEQEKEKNRTEKFKSFIDSIKEEHNKLWKCEIVERFKK